MFREIAAFDVVRTNLDWPWIAFAPAHDRLAFVVSPTTIATKVAGPDGIVDGPVHPLPSGLALEAFAVAADRIAVAGGGLIALLGAAGEERRVAVDTVVGAGHDLRAITFDRTERRLWLSLESATETVLALLDVATLALVGVQRSPPLPRPALHELHVHSRDDAVLLVAACGDEGTFARVVGFAGDEVSAVPSALDAGAIAAGFVGFSSDGMRVHLVEADELRTHAWPTLDELSSVPLADDFISSFSGAVLGQEIYVDGEDAETQEDMLMVFDRSAIRGVVLPRPAPSGMWAGRLGKSRVVVVEPRADPARARVWELRVQTPINLM